MRLSVELGELLLVLVSRSSPRRPDRLTAKRKASGTQLRSATSLTSN